MSNKIYVSYEAVQKYLTHYFIQNKKAASLFDAVSYLYNHRNYSYHAKKLILPEPKTIYIKNLYNILKKMTIEVTSIIKSPQANTLSKSVPEKSFFSPKKDANILLQFQHDKNSLHHHDYFELNLVLQGTTEATLNNQKIHLKTGDFIIISPFTPHQINVSSNSIVVCLTLRKSTFDQAFFSLLRNDDLISNFFKHNLYSSEQNYLLFSVSINYQLLETIQNIFLQAYSSKPQANIICCNYISILLSYALQELTKPELFANQNRNLTNQMVAVINLIKEKSASITLTALSKKFGYDKAYLGKLINKSTGHSFNYLRNYYRLKYSCQLLKYGNDSIEIISEKAGYNSPNHFERCFRELFKETPSRYRKRIHNLETSEASRQA